MEAAVSFFSSAVPLIQVLGSGGVFVLVCALAYIASKSFGQAMKSIHGKLDFTNKRLDDMDEQIKEMSREFSETYVRKDVYDKDLLLIENKIDSCRRFHRMEAL